MWNSMGDGGFLNSSTINSPSTSEKKKPERITNVVPCTIAQIHSLPDTEETLSIGSMSAKIVTFVGVVTKTDAQTTKITYVFTDHTGPSIDVQLWLGETEEQNKKVHEIEENCYARVTGAVRTLKGKGHHVIAFNVRPLQHLNELTMHIAEVIHTSMSVAVMDKQKPSFNSNSLLPSGMMESSTDTFDAASRKLTKPQQLVKHAIINCKDEQGIDVRELYNNLQSLNRQTIQEALDFLSNEGHIYSTIDEDHYKSTDYV
ncbi:replication protein A 32 kDa subunit [Caerostris darwini]|uniref:Replication protein A 32 kDa subunit n=1 Tax=Caerostris darwini TaxID=1538125 RepID=A0AAV4RE52_9ARAC|nr:replication protein A 32 kDa subunit [Caerostris darwini]